MKKATFLFVLLTASLMGVLTSSCSEPIVIDSVKTRIMELTVHSDEWRVYDADGVNYHFVEVDWPFLTEDVLNYGTVVAYVYDGTLQEPLPYVYPTAYDVTNPDGTPGVVIVPQNVRFDFEVGKIYFIREDLDGGPIGTAIGPLQFRAVASVPVQYVID